MRALAFIFFAVGAPDAWALLDARAVLRRQPAPEHQLCMQVKLTARPVGERLLRQLRGDRRRHHRGWGPRQLAPAARSTSSDERDGGANDEVLMASDAASSDRFGYSVAIDGNTIVVGAHCNDGYTGAAYVFRTTDGAPTMDE